MKLEANVVDILLHADGKALATEGARGLNVVPVSTVRVVNGTVWLINYFFGKTLANILANPRVAFAFWKGLEGYQIKGTIRYVESGETFEEARKWIAELLPERVVKGLLILEPEEIYEVTPGAE